MGFLIALLTVAMVLDCVILIFLVLIQLPKKEAGAGLAFGAGATDALFGAGSGTVLTKITKYAAGAFFILAVVLSVMQSRYHHRTATEFEKQLEQAGKTIPTQMAPPPAPARMTSTSATPALSNAIPLEATNQPVAPTNAAAVPKQ